MVFEKFIIRIVLYKSDVFRNAAEFFLAAFCVCQRSKLTHWFIGRREYITRHSFNRQAKLYDLAGRIDYIKNPDRQEHLYTTYCATNDSDFLDGIIIEENQREFHKYNCGGKCVEAKEWIIALEESLVQENPNKIIRAFVDAFEEKYGVECVAALHHNKSKTNYHIHLIFADRKLLAEPVIKVCGAENVL